jgi:aminoglycoside phosphotransferase (APT) family kinase protein
LAESAAANLAPEADLHERLAALGVRVPRVEHFESHNPVLGRSLMITSEISGAPLSEATQGVDVAPILPAAGRDLAVVHRVEVTGFGWVRRDRPRGSAIAAEHSTLQEYLAADFVPAIGALDAQFFSGELARLMRTIEELNSSDAPSRIAHGDFDLSHIYHHDGEYTGIIDFGEIRGAPAAYDLGHFLLHEDVADPERLLGHLLEGYRAAGPQDAPDERVVHAWAALIGARALARAIARGSTEYAARLQRGVRRSLVELDG